MNRRNRIVLRNNVLSAIEVDALISHIWVARDALNDMRPLAETEEAVRLGALAINMECFYERNKRGGLMLSRSDIAGIHRYTSGMRVYARQAEEGGNKQTLTRVLNAIDALLPPRY